MLIGAEKGLFVAREAGGKVSLAGAGGAESDGVLAVHPIADGALIRAAKGLFMGRVETGGAMTLAPVPNALSEPVQVLHDLSGAGVLVGTENGLFLASTEANGSITVAPTAFRGQVLDMDDLLDRGVLIRTGGGYIVARAANGKVTLLGLGGDNGYVRTVRSFADDLLVEAQRGSFLVREAGGQVTKARFGDEAAGRVDALGYLPSGVTLIHGENGWFSGRAEREKVRSHPPAAPIASMSSKSRVWGAACWCRPRTDGSRRANRAARCLRAR